MEKKNSNNSISVDSIRVDVRFWSWKPSDVMSTLACLILSFIAHLHGSLSSWRVFYFLVIPTSNNPERLGAVFLNWWFVELFSLGRAALWAVSFIFLIVSTQCGPRQSKSSPAPGLASSFLRNKLASCDFTMRKKKRNDDGREPPPPVENRWLGASSRTSALRFALFKLFGVINLCKCLTVALKIARQPCPSEDLCVPPPPSVLVRDLIVSWCR